MDVDQLKAMRQCLNRSAPEVQLVCTHDWLLDENFEKTFIYPDATGKEVITRKAEIKRCSKCDFILVNTIWFSTETIKEYYESTILCRKINSMHLWVEQHEIPSPPSLQGLYEVFCPACDKKLKECTCE